MKLRRCAYERLAKHTIAYPGRRRKLSNRTLRLADAFSLLFNVYIRSTRAKLLLSAAWFLPPFLSLFLSPVCLAISAEAQSFSEFLSDVFLLLHLHALYSHLLPFLGNNIYWRDPVAAYATELSTWSTSHAHAATNRSSLSGSGRSFSNFCSPCFRCFAKVFARTPRVRWHWALSFSRTSLPFDLALSLSFFLFLIADTIDACNRWLLRLLVPRYGTLHWWR